MDAVELAAARRQRGTAGLGLFDAVATPDAVDEAEATTRHARAIASVEASATAREDALVARVVAMLRVRHTFTADDVAALLDAAGVVAAGPGALGTRRRLASRVVNGGHRAGHWTKQGAVMTTRANRSGRYVTVWAVTNPITEEG